jgi:alpha-1,3-rhamnosyl/mannosyltransferase
MTTAVVAVSETTRRDLVERLGVAPERVTVVPNGVDRRFFEATPPTVEQQQRLGLRDAGSSRTGGSRTDPSGEYVLMVGTLEPRKNHAGVFAAMRLLGDRVGLPLLVAGRPGWEVEPIRRDAADLVRQGRVRFLDYVPEDDLPALYAGAALLVYPSWYEGFGLPVLEALAVGIPVVISTAPALVEVAGAVAEIADPASPEELAAAIERALGADARGATARELRRERAEAFTWTAAGRRLAGLWRECAR